LRFRIVEITSWGLIPSPHLATRIRYGVDPRTLTRGYSFLDTIAVHD